MESGAFSNWYASLIIALSPMLTQLSLFLPRIVAALIVLVIGAAVARALKKIAVNLMQHLQVSRSLKNTPVEYFVADAEIGQQVEEVLGTILYWLVMLIVIHTSVSILGLQPLSAVLARVINYLPNIVTAIIVLVFGLLLAGLAESLTKGAVKTIDGQSARVIGKVASYLVMAISIMAAISELGIASEFIMIMFVGFIAMITLGFGLALGLGGQDVVRKMLNRWYDRMLVETSESIKK